jgi:hypothetical protein
MTSSILVYEAQRRRCVGISALLGTTASFEGGLRLTLNIANGPQKDSPSLKYPNRSRNLSVRNILGRHDTRFSCSSPDQFSFELDHGS